MHRSTERGRVLAALSGAIRELGVSEIMAAAGLSNRNAADQLLFKMVRDRDIVRISRGIYGLPDRSGDETHKIGKKDRNSTQAVDNVVESEAPSTLSLLPEAQR